MEHVLYFIVINTMPKRGPEDLRTWYNLGLESKYQFTEGASFFLSFSLEIEGRKGQRDRRTVSAGHRGSGPMPYKFFIVPHKHLEIKNTKIECRVDPKHRRNCKIKMDIKFNIHKI